LIDLVFHCEKKKERTPWWQKWISAVVKINFRGGKNLFFFPVIPANFVPATRALILLVGVRAVKHNSTVRGDSSYLIG